MWTSLTSSQLYSIHLYPLSCFCQSLMLKYKQGFVSYFICSPSNIHLKSGPLHMVYPEPQWHIPVFPTAIALAYKHVAHLCHSATDELQLFTLKQMLLKDKNVTTIFAFHECLVKCLLYSALSAH